LNKQAIPIVILAMAIFLLGLVTGKWNALIEVKAKDCACKTTE